MTKEAVKKVEVKKVKTAKVPKTVKVEKTVKAVKTVKVEKVEKAEKTEKTSTTTKGKYFEATGRRKTSVARIRLFDTKGGIIVNDKDYKDYFQTPELQKIVEDALVEVGLLSKMSLTIKINGGGIHSQAEAVRHGVSRALILFKEELKDVLKTSGHLTRDSRMRERKKPGLRRARKSAQWSKR